MEELNRGFEVIDAFISVVSDVISISGGEPERYTELCEFGSTSV